MDGLIYEYFHLKIDKKNSAAEADDYANFLIKRLTKLTLDNPYYIKLTAMFLDRQLPAPYALS